MMLNLSCTVYPSFQTYVADPDRQREQDRAVERVVRTLAP
jgi:hypothetical protein